MASGCIVTGKMFIETMEMFTNTAKLMCLMFVLPATGLAAGNGDFRVDTGKHAVNVRILTGGLEHPWSLAFMPDGRMLVTEKPGRLRIIAKDGTLLPEAVSGLPQVKEHGQGGLLDVVLHPEFGKNHWVYLSYAAEDKTGIGTEVVRGKLLGNKLQQTEIIFRALPKSKGGQHFGSRLLFDTDGKLLITLGERGNQNQAQHMDTHPGSIIRLNDDGSVPADNPFLDNKNARPEIYAYGTRNAQGIAPHPSRQEIWIHEHGPQGGDEINIVKAGVNYGWPVITYGVNYGIGTRIGEGHSKPGMEQPLYYWVPSIAPSGMAFYTGNRFTNWKNNLFVGSLKFQLLVRLEIKDGKVVHEERLLEKRLGRIRDVRTGPDGFIYLLTDSSKGVLARLEPAEK
jgi:glucose/arabinose dehydrogenase